MAEEWNTERLEEGKRSTQKPDTGLTNNLRKGTSGRATSARALSERVLRSEDALLKLH